MTRYLIDANIFITAKNTFYQFSFAQCFWELIEQLHKNGMVYSIKAVKDEILAPKKADELQRWAKSLPPTFWEDHFLSTYSYRRLMQYAQTLNVHQKAKDDFAQINNADAWIIAHTMEHHFEIVTQETYNPDAKKRIMIPNVARDNQVKTLTLFEWMQKCAGHNFTIK